jgi:hypothetical protein
VVVALWEFVPGPSSFTLLVFGFAAIIVRKMSRKIHPFVEHSSDFDPTIVASSIQQEVARTTDLAHVVRHA